MKKIYVAPSASRKDGYPNRYGPLLKKELARYFEVLEADDRPCLMQGLSLLVNSFKADVFLLSFVESIAFHKLAFIQYLMARLALRIMKLRRRRIVFIFHNPRPHKGENHMSRELTRMQLLLSSAVVSHSGETAGIARAMLSRLGGDPSKVVYACHPMVVSEDSPAEPDIPPVRDALVWGRILPYKGVEEFVSDPSVREAGLSVLIVGRCDDPGLAARIEDAVARPSATRFVFENRAAGFDELRQLVRSSAHVVFPYIPGSISGSGVLMDTIAMGGTPVGPSTGAFLDLNREGVCDVYGSYGELVSVLRHGRKIPAGELRAFAQANSWPSFARRLSGLCNG